MLARRLNTISRTAHFCPLRISLALPSNPRGTKSWKLAPLSGPSSSLDYSKHSANGHVDFLSRLPATAHDRSGSSSLTPLDDGCISSPGPATFASVPRRPSVLAWEGWCRGRKTRFWVVSGSPLPIFCDFRRHGPRMRIDELRTPSGGFVGRVSAAVITVDHSPGLQAMLPAADTAFASVFAPPSESGTGSAGNSSAAAAVAQHTPSPTSILPGTNSATIIDPGASVLSPPRDPAPPTA